MGLRGLVGVPRTAIWAGSRRLGRPWSRPYGSHVARRRSDAQPWRPTTHMRRAALRSRAYYGSECLTPSGDSIIEEATTTVTKP